MPMNRVFNAIVRSLGRVVQLAIGVGIFIGVPSYAIWHSEWVALIPWAIIIAISIGMIAGPLPTLRRV